MENSVLLIGGAGYIGPVITANLLNSGAKVTCLDLLLYENKKSIENFLTDENYSFIHGDLSDFSLINPILKGITDVVILAGLVGDPITKKYPKESKLINEIKIMSLINHLNNRGLNKVIFVSTCSNYGLIPGTTLADENYPLNPLSSYAESKVAVEEYILDSRAQKDYSPTVLRFATAFGVAPRMRFDLTVNEFVLELASSGHVEVYDPDTWRPYCHVKDFARLINLVLSAPNNLVSYQIFNSGDEINTCTKRDLIKMIQAYIPNIKVNYLTSGGDPRNYKVNFSKVRESLGFIAEYTIQNGIAEIINEIKSKKFNISDKTSNYHGNYDINFNNL